MRLNFQLPYLGEIDMRIDDDLINAVEDINIARGNEGLFVWLIASYWGGIGKHFSSTRVDWNVVPGFSDPVEMRLALEALKEKYEIVGRKSPETG